MVVGRNDAFLFDEYIEPLCSNFLILQVLRTKRPFVVSVLDATGEEVCRVDSFIPNLSFDIVVE